MIDIDNKKIHLVDSGFVTLDWMVYKEDVEDLDVARLSIVTFVDIYLVSIMLGIEIEEIEELIDEKNSARDPDFPRPEVRRGKQVRWRLKSLIDYIKRKVESDVERRCDYRFRKALEDLRSLHSDSSEGA